MGPLFGEVLARALDRWWDELGRPAGFTVVDAGAGRGTLARSILAAEPVCGPALDLVLVERSEILRGEHPHGVTSLDAMPDRVEVGVVVANELLDNLAFRVIERTADGWCDVFVDLDADGELVERLGPPAGSAGGATGATGARVPVQTAAHAWVTSTVASIGVGALVAIDYASTTAALAAQPEAAWLRTYRRQRRGAGPLDQPGAQDLTADVCVDQLPPPDAEIDQASFLRQHGLDDLVADGRRIWQERAHLGDLRAVRARSRLTEADALTDRDGLGSFVVMKWDAAGQRGRTITL